MVAQALPLPKGGILRVVSPENLSAANAVADQAAANQNDAAVPDLESYTGLSGFINGEFQRFARHRDGAAGWSDRLIEAMQAFKGVYPAQKMAEIKKFGGSTVYARVVATKCRGASSLLRDVYLNTEKPWGLEPTPDPTLPDDVISNIQQLVNSEVQNQARLGSPPSPEQIRDRVVGLMEATKHAALKKARTEADTAQEKLDDILTEGRFYEALAAFLVDLPLFPFACIKGPVVKIVPSVKWVAGKAVKKNTPKMFWGRVSPFDIWWTPGVANIADAAVIEKSRVSRADLNQLIGLPGYNDNNLKAVLEAYGKSGYVETTGASSDATRADLESRENPTMNESGLMDMLEYHGYIQGQMLLDQGYTDGITDPTMDYFVDCFKIGRYVIKCQTSPSLKQRAPYYITSFEKVPGTVVGNGLPDILTDIADVANAALRSLVNNLSISSGPQVVVNDDRIAPNEDGDELYPWKRWHVENDPLSGGSSVKPVEFFNVESHAQELLGVYEKFTQIADDLSAIPRYITGSERTGGAGRTASGLAMLMGNAAKILQTVAANIDRDVISQVLSELYDMVMLTDTTGILRGDESIKVLGVNVAVQRETERQRQMEMLQMTANPIDMQIMGVKGRAALLRAVSSSIGLAGQDIVPPDDELDAKQAAQGAPPGGGGPPGGPGGPGSPGGPAAPGGPQQAIPGGANGPPPQAIQGPATNVVGNG